LKQLWDRLTTNRPFKEQLDEIIATATGLEPWIEAFVRTPAALDYCARQSVRWNSALNIYLLSTTQMNGFHAELFSYSLYHDVLSALDEDGSLKPLKLSSYHVVKGTEEEPYLRLDFDHGDRPLWFWIEFKNGWFHTRILHSTLEPFPEINALLRDSGGFVESEHALSRNSASNAIEDSLIELAGLLAMVPDKNAKPESL
jgi:hypothetical protein